MTQAETTETSGAHREHAADRLQNAADGLRERAELSNQRLNQYSNRAADKMSAAADYLRNHDMSAMWHDVEQIVRRHPGEAITVALVLGMVAGRSMRRG